MEGECSVEEKEKPRREMREDVKGGVRVEGREDLRGRQRGESWQFRKKSLLQPIRIFR